MSKVEVNEIDKQSGSTLTLGGSGTAVTISELVPLRSGFGRTGTVDWQTGSVKDNRFYCCYIRSKDIFVDTNGGAVTA